MNLQGPLSRRTFALLALPNGFKKEKASWNLAGAAVCLTGAVFFIFRK